MTIVYDNSVISKPEIRTLVPSSFKGSRSRSNGIVSKTFKVNVKILCDDLQIFSLMSELKDS